MADAIPADDAREHPLDGDPGREPAPIAVRLTRARVTYQVYESPGIRIRDVARRRTLERRVRRRIDALRDVDLTIREGESVAVIGHNGAGKSTLVRAIAGLQPLDAGTLEVSSQPRMLGVQAMLSAAWSGRQSIEVGLIALGIPRADAVRRVEAVAASVALEEAIDRPVSTYSAGMRARLYFAISTEVGGDVLIIDEALAAGDARFRQTAQTRLRERMAESQTLILVSHSMSTVRELCERTVLLADGRIVADGPTDYVVDEYDPPSR